MKQFVIALVLVVAALFGGFLVARHTTIVGPPAWEYKLVTHYELLEDNPNWKLWQEMLRENSASIPPISAFPNDPLAPSSDPLNVVDNSTFKGVREFGQKINGNPKEWITTGLDKMGAAGWELVWVDNGRYYFKRRRGGW